MLPAKPLPIQDFQQKLYTEAKLACLTYIKLSQHTTKLSLTNRLKRLSTQPKSAIAATKSLIAPSTDNAQQKVSCPGHSNKKRQSTERNLRWTDRRHIQDKIQQPHELVQKPKTQTFNGTE